MNKAIVATILILSLPVYRYGQNRGITGWEWVFHHTSLSRLNVTHIPVEDYKTAFQEAYG